MPKLYTKQMTYGLNQPLINVPIAPIDSTIDPTVNDRYNIGQIWINHNLNTAWLLTSYTLGVPIWTEIDNAGPFVGMVWTTEAGAAIAMAVNHGYIVTNAAPVLTLPGVSPIGSEMEIIGQGGIWRINQNNNQQIRFAGVTSTLGAGGFVTSAHGYSTVKLVTRTADRIFEVQYSNDNLNLH